VLPTDSHIGPSSYAFRGISDLLMSIDLYEVARAKDDRSVDLISDSLPPFGRLWYGEPNAKFFSRSHDVVIPVSDSASLNPIIRHISPVQSDPSVVPGGALLSRGVSIKGSVKFLNELLLEGEVEGTIVSAGTLTIGERIARYVVTSKRPGWWLVRTRHSLAAQRSEPGSHSRPDVRPPIHVYDGAGNVIESHESHRPIALQIFRELNLAVSVEEYNIVW
jgi:hypothetical protein